MTVIRKDQARQMTRFCLVGAANTGIDLLAFAILTASGLPYMPAQVMAYSAGTINSFFCNRQWTFHVKGPAGLGEFGRFVLVNLLSLLVSTAVLYGAYQFGHLSLWPGKLAATACAVAVNFTGSRRWVFSEKVVGTGTGSSAI